MASKKSHRRSGRDVPGRLDVSNEEWIHVLQAFYRRRRRQKVVGWCLLGLAGAVAVQHFLRHVNTIDITPFLSMGLQDVVVGYPMAGVMLFVGVVLLGQSDEPPSRAGARRR
jgi:hypothetical protein